MHRSWEERLAAGDGNRMTVVGEDALQPLEEVASVSGQRGEAAEHSRGPAGLSDTLGDDQVPPGCTEGLLSQEGRSNRLGGELQPSLHRAVALGLLLERVTDLYGLRGRAAGTLLQGSAQLRACPGPGRCEIVEQRHPILGAAVGPLALVFEPLLEFE